MTSSICDSEPKSAGIKLCSGLCQIRDFYAQIHVLIKGCTALLEQNDSLINVKNVLCIQTSWNKG